MIPNENVHHIIKITLPKLIWGNLQFSMKVEVTRKSEKLNNLNENVFELTIIIDLLP